MRFECFGVPIDAVTAEEALASVERWCASGEQHYIVTPNPEMVILAKHDAGFATALRHSSLSLLDGVGLLLASRLFFGVKTERITGSDFLEKMLMRMPKERFFFLGAGPQTAEEAAKISRTKYGANIVGLHSPTRGTYSFKNSIEVKRTSEHAELLRLIQEKQPTVLVVALGHGQQEKWMRQYLSQCPSVRVAIGVGGALDHLACSVKRAPAVLRRMGLEWLWRLILEPRRIKRIWTAVVLFPIEVARWLLSSVLQYRKSVVGCVINNEGQVLLVQRLDEAGYWQFPQGGVEKNETHEKAVLREMEEELGTNRLQIVGKSKRNVYRYRWPRGTDIHNASSDSLVRRYGYRGQKQTIYFIKFTGTNADFELDQQEHTAWRWVKPEDVLTVIHPVRRPMAELVLNELSRYVVT